MDIYFVLLYLCIIISDRRFICGMGTYRPNIIDGPIISEEASLVADFISGAALIGTRFIFSSWTPREHIVSDRGKLSSL